MFNIGVPELLIILANKQFEQISGCGKPDIEGKQNFLEFVYEDDIARVKEFTRHRGAGADATLGLDDQAWRSPAGKDHPAK